MKKFLAVAMLTVGAVAPVMAEVYEYESGPFNKLMVRGNFDVVYRNNPDSTGFMRYEADRNFGDKIEVACSKGKLSIISKLTQQDYGKLPVLYLYSDYIEGITNEGDGTIVAETHMSTPTLTLKQIGNGKIVFDGANSTELSANLETGSGTIVVRGKCREAKFTLTGAGVIQADQLYANVVNCMTLGTGSIGCRPLDALDVRGLGTTKIYYYGNPTIKKVGAAKLEPMFEQPVEPSLVKVDNAAEPETAAPTEIAVPEETYDDEQPTVVVEGED